MSSARGRGEEEGSRPVRHLAAFAAQDENALVFTSPAGGPLRHGNFRRRYWLPALDRCGLTDTH
jgi:hypothetical protein